ncbi:MAG: FkbM family methyltransferase [Candidatus Margulisiibacteriota bacterium]
MANIKDQESIETLNKLLQRLKCWIHSNFLERNEVCNSSDFAEYIKIKKTLRKIKNEKKVPFKELLGEVFHYHNGLYFLPEKIKKRLSNSIFIDCGASRGDSAYVFCQYAPKSVLCFEADTNLYNELIAVIKHCQLKVAIPINLFVSNVISDVLRSTTIDNYLEGNADVIGLIKMDIEGGEHDAIQGAKLTILKEKPILLISIYHNARDFFEIKSEIEKIRSDYCFLIRQLAPLPFNYPLSETYLIAY